MQKNILFIMMDQLRWDCLSCYGHPVIETPNLDALAKRGVRFTNAYVQGSSCGNSRAAYYTGRHVRSNGATWNDWPFHVAEWTLADYLKPAGVETILLGKTHMKPDLDGMKRLGIDPASELGKALSNAGFLAGEHDDGLHPEGPLGRYNNKYPRYNTWLNEQGFDGDNGWLQWANAVEDDEGVVRSGFHMKYVHKPARLPKEYSETAYMTDRAIETIDHMGDKPWCIHLSYIKPHWPIVASAPYNDLYRGMEIPKAIKNDAELNDPHPIYKAFMGLPPAKIFSDDAKRAHVIPTYLGLVKQIDDELGRLFNHLKSKKQDSNTLIAICSDHGDYLGDHWLGEKDLFHDSAAKIPFILFDPSTEADNARGRVESSPVCAIDLIPTFLDFLGQEIPQHRLEGETLLPALRGEAVGSSRNIVVCEDDYGRFPFAKKLGRDIYTARMTMAFDGRHKLIHCPGFAPMLFDLANDPNELVDLGRDAGYAAQRSMMQEKLLDWSATLKNRAAIREEVFKGGDKSLQKGIIPGFWSGDDVPEARKIPAHTGVF